MRYEHASNWRQSRKGKARIPDELWSAAVEVARRDGVNQTATALHLDGGKLKLRMLATGPVPDKTMPAIPWHDSLLPRLRNYDESCLAEKGV